MTEVFKNSNYATYEDEKDGYLLIYTTVNLYDYSIMQLSKNSRFFTDDFVLLFEEAYKDNVNVFNISSLVDDNNNYISFVFETSEYERTIRTDGKVVISDSIYLRPTKFKRLGVVYNSNLVSDKIELMDYLKMKPVFINDNDEVFKNEIDTSRIIENFINTNSEIKNQIKLNRTPSFY